MADCTFTPKRVGRDKSEKLLIRAGRKKLAPDDLIRYEKERIRKIEIRKLIMREIEKEELTFKPQVGEKSMKIQVRLLGKYCYILKSKLAHA